MAGVAVLQPHDVVKQRVSYRQPRRCRRNSSSNPKNNRRKQSPQKNQSTKNPHVVKILKRGEVLTSSKGVNEKKLVSDGVVEDLVLSTTDGHMVSKQIAVVDFYALPAFVSSPPPSSLPVPAFLKKKIEEDNNHEATSDLRRLLRLDRW